MIGYLKGKVLSCDGNNVLLENNGVGFEVACSSQAYERLVKAGAGEIFVYTAVREDGIFLYGFENPEEKQMFLKLIGVSGVGPKMGITVLSQMSLSSLAIAIATSDVKTLSKIKGLGKKTAERIILELREKITEAVVDEDGVIAPRESVSEENQDAVIALMGLGFTKQECERAVNEAVSSGEKTIEKIIAYAIKHIK